MISSISVTEFIKRKISDQIIDIRSIEKFNHNHIPGAKNIPYEKLLLEPDKYLDKFKVYYIYCQKGIKSLILVKKINKSGYKLINIEGGYESWILEK